MRTVYKYELKGEYNSIVLPDRADVVHVGLDPRGARAIWCLIDNDPSIKQVSRTFVIKVTGAIVESNLWYVGTLNQGPLVLHVFEKV